MVFFPLLENDATIPFGVAFEVWPPVLEYTCVFKTKILTSSPLAKTWSIPEKPISKAQPSPPIIQTLFLII